jgi:hypothetical protein
MMERPVVVFFAGFLIAAVLGLGGVYVWRQTHSGPRPTGDDDPIVVAGGSLKIGSRYGFELDSSSHQKANHKHKGRTVDRIEIWSDDNAPRTDQFFASGRVDVDIEYCPDLCVDSGQKHDHVTFTAPNGKKLMVSSDTSHPIGDEANLNPILIDHQPNQPNQGRVKQIVVSGKLDHTPLPFYPCAANGKCHVVLHYGCPTTGEDDCKNEER